VVENGQWRPEIVDEDTGSLVQRACAEPAAPPPAVTRTPAEAPAAAETPVAAEAPAPAPAPATLPVPVARRPVTAANLPGSGLTIELGFFFGGDSLVDVMFTNALDRSLSAGRGVQLAGGGLWTPLWADDHVGFGLGASFGWKYDTISWDEGSVSLTRLPVSLTAHSLLRLNERWFVLLRGGLATELGGWLSGTGSGANIHSDLSARLGLLGEAGLYYQMHPVAVGAGLRYTALSDNYLGNKVDASSVGIVAFGQYGF
jgi:hypothetical protein